MISRSLLLQTLARATTRHTSKKPIARLYSTNSNDQSVEHAHTNRVARHFLAIFPPTIALDAIERTQQKIQKDMPNSKLRWVSRPNIHLTLKFFGSALADPKIFTQTTQMVDEAVGSMEPFEIEVKTAGVFPRWDKPRILWLGVDKGKEELRQLRKRLEKGFKEIGLKDEAGEESKFSPHFTIGRWNDVYVKSLQGEIAKDATEVVQYVSSFTVRETLMINSDLNPEEPIYTPVHFSRTTKDAIGVRRRSRYQQDGR